MSGRRAQRCRLCRAKLKTYERPEGICDRCLRAHQTWPLGGAR
jgi:hypothetical protein